MEHVGDPFEGCRDVFAVGNTALHDRQAIGFRQDAMVAEGADPGVREVRSGEDAINKGAADFAGVGMRGCRVVTRLGRNGDKFSGFLGLRWAPRPM